MLFRQLFDQDSSTYTYLLADAVTREAVLIDPVFEQFDRDRTLLEELQLQLRYVLDTHVHADHVTSGGLLRDHFGAKTVLSERAGVVCSDLQVKHGDQIRFGSHALEVRETPGHTAGCLSYVCHETRTVFTGDALLIRACGRTDFQQGDPATLYRSVHEQILSLPGDFTIYPAHDYKGRTASSVDEERRWNPRLGQNKVEADFVKIMNELGLPYPRKLDTALPANSRCGVLQETSHEAVKLDTTWAPIELSSVGVPEISAEHLAQQASNLLIIDVREQDEYRGELGHIRGSQLVPLSTLSVASRQWPADSAVVTVCRSGGRSGKAALQLARAGFSRVASLRGGMVRWNAQQLPIERGYIENRQG
ncbi:MAG TPA: MBL fold metallo-hydrolase [Polyangiales bacterium]|nr:MBL fold metallo-hydrolase [Polyangiales bacterium]